MKSIAGLSEFFFKFLKVKSSIYLNRRVFVMHVYDEQRLP